MKEKTKVRLHTAAACAGFFLVWALAVSLANFLPDPAWLGQMPALRRLWWEVLPLLAVGLVTVLFGWGLDKGRNRTKLSAHWGRDAGLGLCLGVLWLAVPAVLLWALGALRVTGTSPVPGMWLWVLAALANVAMQEYLVRGYLYQSCKNAYGRGAALAVTTALFTLMHGGAVEAGVVPVLNVLTMSIFSTLLLEYTGGLLAPILAHFVWNAAGCLLLGGVSLAEDYPHWLTCAFAGNEILSGGAYKLEGSVLTLAANLGLCALMALLLRRAAARRRT